jgi:hypothetical protein
MIPPRNLSLLANRLARAGSRRLPEAVLERDYCLAWFLVALSRTPLCERLAFKGGTALKRCYFGDYRFSEDLDFTLATESTFDEIRRDSRPRSRAARSSGARGSPARWWTCPSSTRSTGPCGGPSDGPASPGSSRSRPTGGSFLARQGRSSSG